MSLFYRYNQVQCLVLYLSNACLPCYYCFIDSLISSTVFYLPLRTHITISPQYIKIYMEFYSEIKWFSNLFLKEIIQYTDGALDLLI